MILNTPKAVTGPPIPLNIMVKIPDNIIKNPEKYIDTLVNITINAGLNNIQYAANKANTPRITYNIATSLFTENCGTDIENNANATNTNDTLINTSIVPIAVIGKIIAIIPKIIRSIA